MGISLAEEFTIKLKILEMTDKGKIATDVKESLIKEAEKNPDKVDGAMSYLLAEESSLVNKLLINKGSRKDTRVINNQLDMLRELIDTKRSEYIKNNYKKAYEEAITEEVNRRYNYLYKGFFSSEGKVDDF